MPMTLILGRTGCGKTGYMAKEIAKRIDGGQENITLLVPDQYTVASEGYFLRQLGEKRFRRLNVTTVKSLARTKFAQYGLAPAFLGEGGKTVLLKKALDAVSPQLRHYPPNYKNPRFLALILGAIKEMKAAGISADDLMKTALVEQNDKLYDLALIRQVYEEALSSDYFDPEDTPARLKQLLEETGDFENEAVYVANFRTFYNRERNILLQMVKNGADVTVALPTHTLNREEAGPTADSAEEARKIVAYCKRMGEACRIVDLQKFASFEREEFALLEEEYACPSGKSSPKTPEYIHLYAGADRFDEAEYTAATIAKKVREEGYHYRDFTLIVRSLEEYGGILDPIFEQYEIPLFYHRKTPLRQRNPIPMISALFSMATEGYSREAVLAFVKSGFVSTPEKAAFFERYVKVWAVGYNRFLTPFTRPITGYSDRETDHDKEAREGAEELRRLVINRLEDFKAKTKDATVKEISTALYELLEYFRIPARLEENAEGYREHGEYELAARQKKVYEQLMLALDELVLTAGDDKISLKEYRDLFFAVIDTHDIAILPTSLDEVTAGSPETLPMISPRCVFVLGLNEGVFPRNIDDNRLLTDQDREQLSPFGIGETTDDKIAHEMFYLYLALTAPREELYLSYAAVTAGEAAPSSAIARILQIFPSLATEQFRLSDKAALAKRIQRERAAFALHTKTPVAELGRWFQASPHYGEVLEKREKTAPLSGETAAKLYPKHLTISASKADRYHQCQYAYFLNYGLKISPWRPATLDPLQRGNIVHEALELMISQGLDCDDETLKARVEAFGEGQLKKFYGNDTPPETVKNYFGALMKKIFRLLTLFRKEFAATEFVPYAFEQRVGYGEGAVPPVEIPLEEGSLSVIGVVDRIDRLEKDGINYLRVVDYKSGNKDFSLNKVKHGIDIQMLMYLYALQQNLFPGKCCRPAGVQYVKADAGTVSALRKDPEEEVLLQWEKELPRSGIYLKDDEILAAFDKSENKIFLRGTKKKNPPTATLQEFDRIFGDIYTLLEKMGNALHRGEVKKNPIKIDSYESCEKCDLKDFCRHPAPADPSARKEETHA